MVYISAYVYTFSPGYTRLCDCSCLCPIPDTCTDGASTGEEDGTAHHNQEEPDVNPGGSPQPPALLRDLSPKPLNTIESVSHLLRVLRIFIMMSMVEEEGSKEHREHLVTALDITVILWKVRLRVVCDGVEDQAEGAV